MADIEKVIKGLEHCVGYSNSCFECPYSEDGYSASVHCKVQVDRDALELLKEQEDLGTELTNAVELIHKKNARIEILNTVLNEQPQIVRCKDCVHYNYHTGCKRFLITGGGNEWFCADGERKKLEGEA